MIEYFINKKLCESIFAHFLCNFFLISVCLLHLIFIIDITPCYLAVILDSSGYTKGYGFVRFGNEEEQRNALYAMNGYTGLGSKPLKICTAVPKPKGAVTTPSSTPTTASATYSSGTVCFSNYKLQRAGVT